MKINIDLKKNKKINRKVVDYFNTQGGKYSLAWSSLAKKRLSEIETDFVQKAIESIKKNFVSKRIKTLDIGAGNGRIGEAILKNNVEYYGLDISNVMVDYCKKKFKGNKKVKQIIVGDVINPLSKKLGKFDFVTAIRVLSYTPLWKKAIYSIYKAMNYGGTFVFTFPNRYSSMFISKIAGGKKYMGYETGIKELKKIISDIGFVECNIIGFNKLLDIFYDWCNNKISVDILFGVEKVLKFIFGETLFAREFYIICKK